MPSIDSANHRSKATAYELHETEAGWRIQAGWWGFDLRGERDWFHEWLPEVYADEAEARHVLAELQRETDR